MIDFTPDQPAGAVLLIVFVWIMSGLIGMAVRVLLLRKYWIDLEYSSTIGASLARKSISQRGIETSVLHLLVKLLIVAIGVASALVQFNTPEIRTPTDVAAFALAAIPWLLTLDGVREYWHQRSLLSAVEPLDLREVAEDTNRVVRRMSEAIQQNTVLTQQAVENAQAAYQESNNVNEKIAHLTQAAVVTNQEGNVLLTAAAETGEETLVRVIRVEKAVVQEDENAAQLAAEAARRDERLDALEEQRDQSES